MKQSQSKNNTGQILLMAALLLAGEGIFYWGGYWVPLLLWADRRWGYILGFLAGLVVSALTNSQLGVASLTIVLGMFVFSRVTVKLPVNAFLVIIFAVLANLILDLILKSHWSVWEVAFTGVLVIFTNTSGGEKEELRLLSG